jgi:hypothetical protein
MQGSGLRGEPLMLFEDVGDIFAGEGLAIEGVLNGAGEVVLTVDVGESDDFVDVGARVKAALGELMVVLFGARAQRVEAQQELGVTGLAALVEELFYVVGIFEVAAALVAAGMSGNQVVGVIDAKPVGKEHALIAYRKPFYQLLSLEPHQKGLSYCSDPKAASLLSLSENELRKAGGTRRSRSGQRMGFSFMAREECGSGPHAQDVLATSYERSGDAHDVFL